MLDNNFFEILLKANLCQFDEFNNEVLSHYKNNLLYVEKHVENTSNGIMYFYDSQKIQYPPHDIVENYVKSHSKSSDIQVFETLLYVLNNINKDNNKEEKITTPGPITYYVEDSDLLSNF